MNAPQPDPVDLLQDLHATLAQLAVEADALVLRAVEMQLKVVQVHHELIRFTHALMMAGHDKERQE